MDHRRDAENTLELVQKLYKRAFEAVSETGYRDGIEEGAVAVFQDDFDQCYKEGFKAAFELGMYKGFASGFPKNYKHPDNIAKILDKTRCGACHICVLKSKKKEIDGSSYSADNTLANHREHVSATLKTLREYFEPLMKERGIDINQLKTE